MNNNKPSSESSHSPQTRYITAPSGKQISESEWMNSGHTDWTDEYKQTTFNYLHKQESSHSPTEQLAQEPPPDEYVRGWNDCRKTDLKEQAELVAENERLKADVDRLKAAPDYDPLTSEEVWKLIETYKKAGWYDDEFVLEIERQKVELEQLRSERDKMREALEAEQSKIRKLNNVLMSIDNRITKAINPDSFLGTVSSILDEHRELYWSYDPSDDQ